MSAYVHQGRVYFIACGGYVKIGYSSGSVDNRLLALSSARRRMKHAPADLDCVTPMYVLATIPGCIMRDERRVQGLFAAHHEVGEWFRLTPAFERQLALLQYVTDREVLANFRDVRRDLKRRARLEAAA